MTVKPQNMNSKGGVICGAALPEDSFELPHDSVVKDSSDLKPTPSAARDGMIPRGVSFV